MNPPLSSSDAYMVLNAIPHLGPVNTRRLLDAFSGDPFSILEASRKSLLSINGIGEKAAGSIREWAQRFDLEREKNKLSEADARFINHSSELYPARLKNIYDPPVGLYQIGNFEFKETQPFLAIVGSRRTTLYGLRMARQFAQRLAGMGFCIVSGLARGVDTAAHEGALEAGGDTVAVLGNGLDIIYPPENLDLYRKIQSEGAILTEFCFGRRADRQTFPMRNRIVSGLCDGVLVIESDEKGGSMITARFAGEQGRQVYAIPGRIDQSTSRGCHQLIKDGAILTTCVEDILDDMRYRLYQPDLFATGDNREKKAVKNRSKAERFTGELDSDELLILDVLHKEKELSMDELVLLTELSVSSVAAKLMMLELKKQVKKQVDGSFIASE